MSIAHKFKKVRFNDSFMTENGILAPSSYKPEVLILGTFNPHTPNANFADFFYGRNYFWKAFKYIFILNKIGENGTRMPRRGFPNNELDPSLNEIFELCNKLKLTFSDLILEVFPNINDYEILKNDNIRYLGKEYNLIRDGRERDILGLEDLDKLNLIKWNTENILNYLENNPQIKQIYFTRRPTGIWDRECSKIKRFVEKSGGKFTNIFTPSGQGAPVLNSIQRLINHWIFNEDLNFGKLDRNWLILNNVDVNQFQINNYINVELRKILDDLDLDL